MAVCHPDEQHPEVSRETVAEPHTSMPVDTTKHVPTQFIRADINTLNALSLLTGFSSPNTSLTVANVNALMNARAEKEKAYVAAQAVEKNARDAFVAAEWAVHNAAIQLRAAVIAQWGPDSDQLQTIGGKKKSERARPRRESSPAAVKLAS